MLRGAKVGLAAVVVAAFAGVLGTAAAQDPATAPAARVVTTNGSGETIIATTANQADREAAYRATLGDAIDAAKAKAAFVAQRAGVQLGAVQAVTEITSSPDRFCGGFAVEAKGVSSSAPVARRVTRKRKVAVKGAQVDETRCYVPAAVTVSYAVTG